MISQETIAQLQAENRQVHFSAAAFRALGVAIPPSVQNTEE
jgi:hypothetical protein